MKKTFLLLALGVLGGCQSAQDSSPVQEEPTIIIEKDAIKDKRGASNNESSFSIQKTPVTNSTDKRFEWSGAINGSIGIHGYYQIANGNKDNTGDILVGNLIYDKVGIPIKLIGQISSDGKYVRILEMEEDGNITGILSGEWKNGSIQNGSWFSPIKRNDFSLSLESKPQAVEKYKELTSDDIVGEYEYQYGDEGATGSLSVLEFDGSDATVRIICVTSPPAYNIADVEEIVVPVKNNTARVDFDQNCQFFIRFFEGFAVIDYTPQKTDCMFGHNAHVDGIFRKTK